MLLINENVVQMFTSHPTCLYLAFVKGLAVNDSFANE